MTAEPFAHNFPLDDFQRRAAEAIAADENVLVSAPTGSGKTVVAEQAIARALSQDLRCFYTAPIKALSNQKYNDLVAALGGGRVGLLTGDRSLNPGAPVVVMTTEVLRNMIYEQAHGLVDLGWVIVDEVHFLADAYRGPVWEEVVIHTPAHVRFVCLSATVSNADELGSWISGLRGTTRTIVEHRRPVTLDSHLLVTDRVASQDLLVPLLVERRVNPAGRRFDEDRPRGPQHGRRARSRYATPRRANVVERLREEKLLPAIYFIFSRAGCDEAASRCAALTDLTTAAEKRRIRSIISERTAQLGPADREVLGYRSFAALLESGIAAHHAGMVPPFREAVELCFVEGLIKVVFATETLALGINMPARSVVIEKLSKFNGESHEPLSPSLYTQLTGRAGRRGIDHEGHAVVLWSPFATFAQVAELAASRDWQLESSFRPNYNMAANLIDRYDRGAAFEVLGLSFAQFQADRRVHSLEVDRERRRRELATLENVTTNDREALAFDVAGYVALLEAIEEQRLERRRRRFDIDRYLGSLRPGDVLALDPGDPALRRVVLTVSTRRGGAVRLTTVDTHGRRTPVTNESDWAFAPVVSRIELPVPYLPKDREFRAEAGRRLGRLNTRRLRTSPRGRPEPPRPGTSLAALRERLAEHPLSHHPGREQLLEDYERSRRLRHDLRVTEREISRTGTNLARRLETILEVMEATDHCDGWNLTPAGERLRRIYHECDLLISLALGDGLLDGLDTAELAALASCFTYEHRSSEPPPEPVIPTRTLRDRYAALLRLWARLGALENRSGATPTREPQGGFMAAAWTWASGEGLELIVDEDLSGGDFVRNVRQLTDLLDQIAQVSDSSPTARTARQAAESLRRGVVLSVGDPT